MARNDSYSERASYSERPVSPDQVARIASYLGKHSVKVIDVSLDYDFVEQQLTITALPSEGTKADAENVLGRVVSGIKYIYPDELDKTA
jgi:hypothetical protein